MSKAAQITRKMALLATHFIVSSFSILRKYLSGSYKNFSVLSRDLSSMFTNVTSGQSDDVPEAPGCDDVEACDVIAPS